MSDPVIGKQLGDYVIQSLLGRGGMARVYKGYDDRLQRYAAVKIINSDFNAADQAEYTERFRREARAIARLNHPNIVGVYQFGEFEGNYYMAMVFLDGRDLRQILKDYAEKRTLMPLPDVLNVIRGVSSALDYAHSRGVIHRDIKPSNIVIDTDNKAILTDFGLALTMSEGTLGDTFGSAHYIAPEQAVSSAKAVPQSDLYSLGVCLYEMLAGKVPFDDPSAMSVALKHLNEPPPPPHLFNPALNPAIEQVILKVLDKDPARRYPSGAALVQALEAAVSTDTRRPGGPQPTSVDKTDFNESTVQLDARKVAAQLATLTNANPAPTSAQPASGAVTPPSAPNATPRPNVARRADSTAPQVVPGQDDVNTDVFDARVARAIAERTVAPDANAQKPATNTIDSAPSPTESELKRVSVLGGANVNWGDEPTGPGSIASASALRGPRPADAKRSTSVDSPVNRIPLIVGAVVAVLLVIVFIGFASGAFGGSPGGLGKGDTVTPSESASTGATGTAKGATLAQTAQTAVAVLPSTETATGAATRANKTGTPSKTPAQSSTATASPTHAAGVTATAALGVTSESANPGNTVSAPSATAITAAMTVTSTSATSATAGSDATATSSGDTSTAVPLGGTAAANGTADIVLYYDDLQLVLVNVSNRTLNVSNLNFVQHSKLDLRFDTSLWKRFDVPITTDALPAQYCFQVFRNDRTQPDVLQGCKRATWARVADSRWFWLPSDGGPGTFSVLSGDRVIATCSIRDGRCEFVLS